MDWERVHVLLQTKPSVRVYNFAAKVLWKRVPVRADTQVAAVGISDAMGVVSIRNFGRTSAYATSGASGSAKVSQFSLGPGAQDVVTTVRWLLIDNGNAGEYWSMTINPDQMAAPPFERALTRAYSSRYGQERLRTFQIPARAQDWTWSGHILTKEHYENLLKWSKKPGMVVVRDHLGRSFQVLMGDLTVTEPAGRAPDNWKMRYTMNVKYLRRIA